MSCSNYGCVAIGTKICTRCRQAAYCTTLCQTENWAEHKASCKPDTSAPPKAIPCVKIYGVNGGGASYENVLLPPNHSIFKATPLPISLEFGYPLVLQRLRPNTRWGEEDTDNQHATWLMIDPVSGFAPFPCMNRVGTVYVARPDHSPLSEDTLAAITDYVSDILDAFGEEDAERKVKTYYDRARLDRYFIQHNQMRMDYEAACRSPEFLAEVAAMRL